MTCGQSTFVLTRRTPNHRLTTWPSPALRGRTVLGAATCFAGADALGRAADRSESRKLVPGGRSPSNARRRSSHDSWDRPLLLPKESVSPEPLTTRACRASVTRGRAGSRFRRPVAKQGCGQPYCCCSHEASRSTSVERHSRGLCIPFQEARRRGHVRIPGPDVFVTTAWTPTPRPRWLAYEYASN
jgi:hypothetical protein